MAVTAHLTCLKYAVTARLAPAAAGAYKSWLADGHIQALVDDGGALVARVEDCGTDADGKAVVKSVYVFPSREAFAGYERDVAPRLRADGLARFGPESEHPVAFSRAVDDVSRAEADEELAKEGAYSGRKP